MSRGRSRRTCEGMCRYRSSVVDSPRASSMARTSSSVWGAKRRPVTRRASYRLGRFRRSTVFQPVLRDQRQIVSLIEDLAVDLRGQLLEAPDFPVLPGHQLLVHRGDLDVQVVGREVEVREPGELALAGMGEGRGVALERLCCLECGPHAPPARAAALTVFFTEPSTSLHTLSTAIPNTPWPRWRRSITSFGDSHA